MYVLSANVGSTSRNSNCSICRRKLRSGKRNQSGRSADQAAYTYKNCLTGAEVQSKIWGSPVLVKESNVLNDLWEKV